MRTMITTMSLLGACGSAVQHSSVPNPSAIPAEPTNHASVELVEVDASGSRFDPAVPAARLPEGAWMCEMRSVRYAAGEPGDGSCPVCGMNLTQKASVAVQRDGHGDDHDHHGQTDGH